MPLVVLTSVVGMGYNDSCLVVALAEDGTVAACCYYPIAVVLEECIIKVMLYKYSESPWCGRNMQANV